MRDDVFKWVWGVLADDDTREIGKESVEKIAARIRTLEAELAQAKADRDVLGAEVQIIRKVIRGSVKKLPDGTLVELPEHEFRRAWWLEAEEATKATDASGALSRAGGK